MSRYLVDRLDANPRITVRGGTQVTRVDGTRTLQAISLRDAAGEQHEQHGSMKRVAAAVGEGASTVRSVHAAIGVRA